MEEIPCTVHAVKLIRLLADKTSGCGVFDVTFPTAAGVKICCISFTNSYTASVTIKGQPPVNVSNGKFQLLVRDFKLMKTPHFSNESQDRVVLPPDKIASDGPFIKLRFIMKQPSPCWERFGLNDLKFFKKKNTGLEMEAKDDPHEISDEILANEMKKLYSLTHIMKNVKLENEPEHFAVDGSYDINLLSYT
ncbi:nicolin-1-like [Hydractinia symbiolongicarpus]|uniref:nicolin-1-like n=1 Tax=Hydractinia symbiolongicarpus TaxID=13093 RepID=UPI00254FDA97|nr:nicolin-1-like [Hydractinia symbiolongicarpus]XP_057302242.1 nicolin-1-like [Hydractinia symbiolongicarpus]